MAGVIGQLSSDSGIALVVPGYFVRAGILLYTGITAAICQAARDPAPVHASSPSSGIPNHRAHAFDLTSSAVPRGMK